MGTGYNRTDTTNNIATGNIINASDLDAEYDAIDAAFDETTGHDHGGGSGNGAPITKVGPVQDLVVSTTSVTPKTTNTLDLGTPLLKFKDLNLAGNALIAGTLGITGNTTFAGAIISDNTTDSTSTTSGAIQTDGGLGVAKALWVGGLTNIAGATTLQSTLTGSDATDSTSTISGAFKTAGGLGVAKALWVGGLTNIAGAVTLQSTLGVTGLTSLVNLAYTGTLTGGTGVVNLGSGQFYKDASGNVGIGTASPTQKLDIASGGKIYLRRSDSTTGGTIWNGGASSGGLIFNELNNEGFAWQLGGTEVMRINSSGNVGIGTTSPGVKLDVAATIPTIRVNATAGGTPSLSLFSAGVYDWLLQGGTSLKFVMDSTERMRIDASGNVAIGGINPQAKLDVISGSGSNGIALAGWAFLNWDNTNHLNFGGVTSGSGWQTLKFFTGVTERMRIDSNGDLGIGTSPFSNYGFPKVSIKQRNPASYTGIAVQASSNDGGIFIGHTGSVGTIGVTYGSTGSYNPLTFETAGAERMRIDTSGNLCVGTTSPLGKLAINNSGTGQVGFNAGTISSPVRGNLWYDTDGTGWKFQIGKYQSSAFTPQMTFTDAGSVGIGTIAPDSRLDVQNAGATTIQVKNTLSTADAQFKAVNTGGLTLIGRDSAGSYLWENGDFPIRFYTNAANRMMIDSSGNVGIGITPNTKLEVGDSSAEVVTVQVRASGGTAANRIARLSLVSNANYSWLLEGSNNSMRFIRDATECARIDSNGHLCIGLTTVDAVGARNNGIVLRQSGTISKYGTACELGLDSTSGSQIIWYTDNGSTFVNAGSITSSGSTTAYNTSSDKRLKEDKGIATDTSVIDNTIIHDFVWKTDGSVGKGVFAQEAKLVNPLAVVEGTDELGENELPIMPWGVDYSKYVPDLIVYCQQLKKFSQEQQARIEELTTRLNALEGK